MTAARGPFSPVWPGPPRAPQDTLLLLGPTVRSHLVSPPPTFQAGARRPARGGKWLSRGRGSTGDRKPCAGASCRLAGVGSPCLTAARGPLRIKYFITEFSLLISFTFCVSLTIISHVSVAAPWH